MMHASRRTRLPDELVGVAVRTIEPTLIEAYRPTSLPPRGPWQRVDEAVLVASTFRPWTTGAVAAGLIIVVLVPTGLLLGSITLAAWAVAIAAALCLLTGILGSTFVRRRVLPELARLTPSRPVPPRWVPVVRYLARQAGEPDQAPSGP